MSHISLNLPDQLKEVAAKQAARAGLSLDEYLRIAIAARVQAQAETEAYLAARAARVPRGRALEILARAGTQEPIPEDRFDGN